MTKPSAQIAKKKSAVPKTLHIDKRAAAIAATGGGNDDQLLTTAQCAEWLGVSEEWLEIGRHKDYGPPFQRLAGRVIRYMRKPCRDWLLERSHVHTKEYAA